MTARTLRGLWGLLLALACLWPARCLQAAEFYVSAAGRDSHPGTLQEPFATLVRARDEVRKRIAAGLSEDVTVFIRGGVYTLSETLVFGLEDSSIAGHTITYAAYREERPLVSSGVEISGWKKLDNRAAGVAGRGAGQGLGGRCSRLSRTVLQLVRPRGAAAAGAVGRLYAPGAARRSGRPRDPHAGGAAKPLLSRGQAEELVEPRRRGDGASSFGGLDHEHSRAGVGRRAGPRRPNAVAGNLSAQAAGGQVAALGLGGKRARGIGEAGSVGAQYPHQKTLPLAACRPAGRHRRAQATGVDPRGRQDRR